MKKFIICYLLNFFGFYLITKLLKGVEVSGQLKEKILILAGGAFFLAAFNYYFKPFLEKIFFPLKFLTFGFFGLILNIIALEGLDILFLNLIEIEQLSALLIGTIFITSVNWISPKRK